jgi:hypothetical protein
MKKIVFLAFLFVMGINAQAQFGGLLKKAEEKLKEKKADPKPIEQSNTTAGNKVENVATNENLRFEFPDPSRRTYGNGNRSYSIDQLKEYAFNGYTCIRKQEDKGSIHFAKDYPELKTIINDESISKEFAIEFSSTPYKKGIGTPASSFNSTTRGIYCNVKPLKGTIGEAFGVGEKGKFVRLYFNIYHDALDRVGGNAQTSDRFFISPELAKQTYLTLDVMPTVENYVLYTTKSGNENYPFTYKFPYMNNEQQFPKTGKYVVSMHIEVAEEDEWGKATGNTKEAVSIFTYDFSVKDAAAIEALGKAIWEDSKENADRAPVPMPKQWKEATSPLTMGIAQAKLIDMFRNHFDGKLSDFTFVKLHASNANGGWTIEKNELGIPKYKYSSQWYTIFMKSKNGKACFYQGFGLRQNYEGGGKYSASFIDVDKFYYVSCEEM